MTDEFLYLVLLKSITRNSNTLPRKRERKGGEREGREKGEREKESQLSLSSRAKSRMTVCSTRRGFESLPSRGSLCGNGTVGCRLQGNPGHSQRASVLCAAKGCGMTTVSYSGSSVSVHLRLPRRQGSSIVQGETTDHMTWCPSILKMLKETFPRSIPLENSSEQHAKFTEM